MHTAEEDEQMSRLARLAEISYTQHEFIKMTEVKTVINDALQKLIDKLGERDKAMNAQKSMLRG